MENANIINVKLPLYEAIEMIKESDEYKGAIQYMNNRINTLTITDKTIKFNEGNQGRVDMELFLTNEWYLVLK